MAGLLGAVSACARGAPSAASAQTTSGGEHADSATIPRRPFGATGVVVSSLALGGYFDSVRDAALLDRAYALGVRYWETTLAFGGKGYGAYFARHPEHRAEIFLLSKTKATLVTEMSGSLDAALAEIATPYIDFFIVQGVEDTSFLGDEVRRWIERSKREGKLKYFGIATHKNMEQCLRGVSDLGWIDGVVTAYNYRLMQQSEMQDAISACADRGIALTAIKSQGLPTNPAATIGDDNVTAQRSLERLKTSGVDEFQARLMAVWRNPHIASICAAMTDEPMLLANARAAAHWDQLSAAGHDALSNIARATTHQYCTGCSVKCESKVGPNVPIADVMRYLMYARSYGDLPRARAEFACLPIAVRRAIEHQDYRAAEASCPQHLPIAQLMSRALTMLG